MNEKALGDTIALSLTPRHFKNINLTERYKATETALDKEKKENSIG
jgi:hypothetical protein